MTSKCGFYRDSAAQCVFYFSNTLFSIISRSSSHLPHGLGCGLPVFARRRLTIQVVPCCQKYSFIVSRIKWKKFQSPHCKLHGANRASSFCTFVKVCQVILTLKWMARVDIEQLFNSRNFLCQTCEFHGITSPAFHSDFRGERLRCDFCNISYTNSFNAALHLMYKIFYKILHLLSQNSSVKPAILGMIGSPQLI